jgi:hypothetical protein
MKPSDVTVRARVERILKSCPPKRWARAATATSSQFRLLPEPEVRILYDVRRRPPS